MLNSSSGPACFKCNAPLPFERGNVGRSEMCPSCSADVRVCLNCLHYEPGSHNDCREPMADRVVDKNKANFCDYFSLGSARENLAQESKDQTFQKLDDLFK